MHIYIHHSLGLKLHKNTCTSVSSFVASFLNVIIQQHNKPFTQQVYTYRVD